MEQKILYTDILIIGGGTAGCYAAMTTQEYSSKQVIIAEKANIYRSGCLAAGVNALNAYIVKGQTPESYVDYVVNDTEGIVREDLVYSMAKGLNRVTDKMDQLGLPILKDKNGEYVARGNRNIKINGENIKPILAEAVSNHKNITILNRVNVTDYIIKDGKALGAYGFSLDSPTFYVIYAKAVICTTGGASGLYRPNNPGFSRHKMWYSPFNTGAGYAMGIRAGAQMTTFEMRFIALRCKDTIAPTGTISQGVGAMQINSLGEQYEKKYGKYSTSARVYSTIKENQEGRGPCYLETKGITQDTEQELYKAYLNMAPSQTLRWIENDLKPTLHNVEVEGTEPYIVGGHTASGYWIDSNRATTIKGLYAAGDVAGGCPQKYVTGCFVEGEIAAKSALSYLENWEPTEIEDGVNTSKLEEISLYVSKNKEESMYSPFDLEESMQKIMDEYAGGIATGYSYHVERLEIANKRIEELLNLSKTLKAGDLHELLFITELIDRLYVCKVLIAHLMEKKENYEDSLHYINSIYEEGHVKIIRKEFVGRGQLYEHNH